MQIATSPKILGQLLKSARVERGLTQHEAGKLVGLTQAMVSRIETAETNASVDTLFRLLAALGMELVLRPREISQGTGKGDNW
ncbi:MAG: transcriptional regulator [Candidatus Wallbacteria bacterium HGW-Wallbacteria-1]|uniref:Transcriptional regulator n=1 Tax=Candidatus Wallbacteria bacterium HGW-Wallbacteria-1 TaxID=2013854 RepID=A0A2N1PN69_9BACT|nr:MAG: transcriptional regulator [Candidatus Wallbacteria bacterium HGW-Wallbacteria-1]